MQNTHPFPLPLPFAKTIIFRAFLLSQGNVAIQNHFFQYLALIRPHWSLKDEILDDLTHQVIWAFQHFSAQGWHQHNNSIVADEVEQEARQGSLEC